MVVLVPPRTTAATDLEQEVRFRTTPLKGRRLECISKENVDTVRRLNEAYGRGGATWVEFYASDVEAHMWSGQSDGSTVHRGVEGIKEIAALFTDRFDELRWD